MACQQFIIMRSIPSFYEQMEDSLNCQVAMLHSIMQIFFHVYALISHVNVLRVICKKFLYICRHIIIIFLR
jgi:hypothetical protein